MKGEETPEAEGQVRFRTLPSSYLEESLDLWEVPDCLFAVGIDQEKESQDSQSPRSHPMNQESFPILKKWTEHDRQVVWNWRSGRPSYELNRDHRTASCF